jgi:hypothetical protein
MLVNFHGFPDLKHPQTRAEDKPEEGERGVERNVCLAFVVDDQIR